MPSLSRQHHLSIDPSKKGGKRRALALDWRPRTREEIVRKKNRKVISQHLKRIGKAAGRELTLDSNGVSCFSFKKFVLCVEVPEDDPTICLFYSKVCHLNPTDNRLEVQKVLDFYNDRRSTGSQELLQDVSSASEGTLPGVDPIASTTHGVRLSMKEGEEVNLYLSFDIKGLTFQDTADKLEYFVRTALRANNKLEKAKSIPIPALVKPKTELEEAPASPSCSIGNRLRMWSVDSQTTSTTTMSQCSLFSLFTASHSSMP